ncbi:MAG: GNAT family N-acetyltransferase [Chloroflexi bacterium]|jgi:GNAT superfamily N-acetyltransferase|nr:GNAT family N-acetyltransferase [Chloroflexota bacterium]MBT4073375.1 GNAT family N-acetyltransferase [Chloroflexota bacterium]MBT4516224.1 GNAT family N-acetyltransferase [Chloroflexota bacterium]MBT6681724.1 GNAT family N-acetyltransferase [Chloroflexota bacterium]
MTTADVVACSELFVERHAVRRAANSLYPANLDTPDVVGQLLSDWLSTGEGIVAERDGQLLGYLTGRAVSGLGGIRMSFMWEWAHATRLDAPTTLFSEMYTAWCRLTGRPETTLHMAIIFADDVASHDCLVQTGFGRHLIDGGRAVETSESPDNRVEVSRPTMEELDVANEMEARLHAHLDAAPIWRPKSPGGGHVYDQTWIERPSRGLFVSRSKGQITGFISAEAGAQDPKSLMSPPVPHITGAFLTPEARGTGAASSLLTALFEWIDDSGWKSATVDFETSNPEGSGFWLGPAGFTPLLYTMVRRLDPRYVKGA